MDNIVTPNELRKIQLAFSARSWKQCWTVYQFLRLEALESPQRNQVVTSCHSLAMFTGLTEKRVRNSLQLLEKRRFITSIAKTNTGSIWEVRDEQDWDFKGRFHQFPKPPNKTEKERRKLTTAMRYEVLFRDKSRCILCGATSQDTRLVVDHIVPISQGGKSELANLRTLCAACNAGKGAKRET